MNFKFLCVHIRPLAAVCSSSPHTHYDHYVRVPEKKQGAVLVDSLHFIYKISTNALQSRSAILRDLKKERRRLKAELAKVDKAIFSLGAFPVHFIGWKQKALDCMDILNGYTQTAQVLNWVFAADAKAMENEVLRRKYITAFISCIKQLHKTGIIKKFRIPRVQGNFYGLPFWFNENGTLKKNYYGKN